MESQVKSLLNLAYRSVRASLVAQGVKNPSGDVQDAGDSSSIPGSGRSCRRKWQPSPVSTPEKSHGQRILVGYSQWGCKESDTTE